MVYLLIRKYAVNMTQSRNTRTTNEDGVAMGIAIFGLNGAGKSTLTHALVKELNYFEMDVEDYYFPEQKESRKQALEHTGENLENVDATDLEELPYSNPRSKGEVQAAILEDTKQYSDFILSGVNLNWCEEILSKIEIAFWVKVPLEKRLERIQSREEKRFGTRTLPGGDMYEQQKEFRGIVAKREEKSLEESVRKLRCPVVVLDGMLPVGENLEKVMEIVKETRNLHAN